LDSIELAKCQRYYAQIAQGAGVCTSTGTNLYLSVKLPVRMRAVPSVSQTGAMGINDGSSNLEQSSASINSYNEGGTLDSLFVSLNNFSGLTSNRPVVVRQNTGEAIVADAEL